MENHISPGSVFFAIWALSSAGIADASPEADLSADPEPITAALIESYRAENPGVHDRVPAMAHHPKGHKSRQVPPAKARPGDGKLPLSMPAGKNK
jgi:hypothetical protein